MKDVNELTELEFINAVRNHDQVRISKLYNKMKKSTIPFLYNKYGNSISSEDIEDLFHDSFLILCTKLSDPKFVLTALISTFFTQICIFRCSKYLRKKADFQILGEPTESDLEPVYGGSSRYSDEDIDSLNTALAELGQQCKDILTLFYFDNLSHQEIAKKLNLSNADTSKSTASRCKKKLKDNMSKLLEASKKEKE